MERHVFDTTEQWREARKGLFTASEIYRLMPPGKREMTKAELAARPKKGKGSQTNYIEDPELLSEGALTYIKEKAAEILSDLAPDFYNYEMQWGKDNEPQAVMAFAEHMGLQVTDEDFLYCGVSEPVLYTMANIAGYTPDVVISDAIGETKCPKSTTHLDYLLMTADSFRLECPEYFCQMQFGMLLAGKAKGYFISYDPRYKDPKLQKKVIEIPADVDYQSLQVRKIGLAKTKLDEIIARVIALNP